ncbi:hypothetical protein [Paraburkholderia caledonica]|uniref:hypothetical protein n=1 Tax=Paraburkholderia caledonica TaxID=134536 RepID=UPI000B401441|nr:hypothetical protein [Paraburkholderia caledonica]
MTSTVNAIRVFNPHVHTRDGLRFTATFNKEDRACFITGTALAILKGDVEGSTEDIFNARFGEIAMAVSRKVGSTPKDEEILIRGEDVQAPK